MAEFRTKLSAESLIKNRGSSSSDDLHQMIHFVNMGFLSSYASGIRDIFFKRQKNPKDIYIQ